MSQDIRNFFARRTVGTKNEKKTEDLVQGKKRQRKYVLSDSDSDEGPNAKVSKNDKSQKSNTMAKTSPKKSPKTPKKSPVKHEIAKVSVAEMLGKAPVKRVLAPKKKPEENDMSTVFDDDKEFEQTLMDIDEDDCFKVKPNFSKLKGKNIAGEKQNNEITGPSETKDSNLSQDEPVKRNSNPASIEIGSSSIGEKEKVKSVNIKVLAKKVAVSPKEKNFKEKLPIPSNKLEVKSRTHKHSNEIPKKTTVEPNKTKADSKEENKLCTPDTRREEKKQVKSPVKISPQNKTGKDNSKGIGNIKSSGELFQLWVDKYTPTTSKQIIGQQGEKSCVNKLVKWLRDWYKNQDGSKKHTKPSPWAKDDSGAYFKAALLSGPPGIGKTTTAHLVCKELGMDIVEFNASDTRSKKLLSAEVSGLLTSKSLSPFFQGEGEVSKRHVLLMDEVDGMAGNEDKGGVQELIQLIKSSKVPIICMCNDRNHPKIRSLANYCFDLRFYKPRVDQIKGAMMSICFKEKLKIKPETLVDIIVGSNQDIRLVLNHLSMLAVKNDAVLAPASKHVKLGPWDVVRKVFSEEDHKSMTLNDKCALFFHDYSLAPLFVHENYLNVVPHSKEASTKLGKMKLFAKAALSLSTGDIIESAIRSKNAWNLLPLQAFFSSVIPGELLKGHIGGQINFPSWFGKNSRRNKIDRLTQELHSHTRLKINCSKSALRMDYARPLRDHILRPMINDGVEGVQTSLAILHEYNLLKEDIESLNELNNWPGYPDPYAALDPKVKAAFTRAYNKSPVMTPFSIAPPIKKGKGSGGGAEEWEEDETEEIDEENEDDITKDAMISVKKKTDKVKKEKNTEPSSSKGKGKGKREKKK